MDNKVSRLQTFVNESKTGHSSTTDDDKDDNSRNIFQKNLDRLQSFFNKRVNDGSSLNSDDLQGLLQKGDNDPILPSLV
jgi:hypothetical protein